MSLSESDDVAQAQWWTSKLRWSMRDLRYLVPCSFPAYARIFHPIVDIMGNSHRWAEVAARNGRIAHREMQLHAIATPSDGVERSFGPIDLEPSLGSLPGAELRALVDTLAPLTSTPGCTFACLWDGYADVAARARSAPLVETVIQRSYLLFEGRLEEIPEFTEAGLYQSPNVWWPADRTFLVHTEVDFTWTYVAGSADLVAAVLADSRLEARRAFATDRFTIDGDRLNDVAFSIP